VVEVAGGPGDQCREQVLEFVAVNPISPDGDGWRVRSVKAATIRKAWASIARVVHRYQERQHRT
jgi:hypothetical protein